MKSKLGLLLLLIPIVLGVLGIIWLSKGSEENSTMLISGIVETSDVDVASKLAGRIDSVFVKEGDVIQKGTVLARLESKELDAKVEQTKGLQEAAEFKYKMALNGARPEEKEQAYKLYLQATHQYELASKTWERMSKLYADSLISAQEKDGYEFQYRAAKEQMDLTKARYDMALNGARYEEIKMAEGLYHQAENGVNEVLAYYEELTIKSPITGELQKRVVDPGEVIPAGYPIFTILDLSDIWVTLQIREDQMQEFAMNTKHRGTVPALGEKEFEFQVSYVAPMGDFATWRPTNQKGQIDIMTFEVRLRGTAPIDGLRPGMSVAFTVASLKK